MIEILLNIIWFLLIPAVIVFIFFVIHIKLLNQWKRYRFDDNYKTVLWGLLYWVTYPFFGLADVIVNVGPMSVWFWERPYELTVTDRCKRHLKTFSYNRSLTRQQRIAIFIGKHLNYIAPGHV